jgi:hypothetical protein
LGLRVAKRTIQTYLPGHRGPRPRGQARATFLRDHAPDIWVCDFVRLLTNHEIPSTERRGSEGGLWGTILTWRRKSKGTSAWMGKRGRPEVCRLAPRRPARYGKSQAA